MIELLPEEKQFLTAIAQGRSGSVFITFLERRKQSHVKTWLTNPDEKSHSVLRGKASEDNELIELFTTLSKRKE